jgi:arylsulfatase
MLLAPRGERRPSPYPPIVLIVIDTLRADHLGCYGYFRNTSPEIDAFAADALLFERAMTPVGTTLPAHVSLFSSTNPMRHGILGNLAFFHVPVETDGRFRLMAQMLSDLGYDTAAFVSSPAVGRDTGLGVGFDLYSEGDGEQPGRTAEVNTDHVLAWLDDADASRPFFLFVHYVDPHSPYEPPAPFADMYTPHDDLKEFLRRRGVRPSTQVLRFNNRYDGEVRYTDTHVGRVLARLRQRGLYERSAIVLTADHGEGLGQHGWMFHSRIHNEQLLIPMILRLPDRPDLVGQRYPDPVSLIDVLPTLVEGLDLPLPAAQRSQLEGIDALSSERRAYVLAERAQPQRGDRDKTTYFALAGARWKYFHRPRGRDLLFDLSSDPAELQDVLAREPEVSQSLRHLLQQQLDDAAGSAPLAVKGEIPESARDQLRRLGYEE